MSRDYQIQRLTKTSPAIEVGLSHLILQLNEFSVPLTATALTQILDRTNTRVYIATENEKVLGVIILSWYYILTGTRAWIEDVVVDEDHRGRNIGTSLMSHVITEAKELNISQIDLTSRPERVAGNKLYQKLGFKKRETNCYRLILD